MSEKARSPPRITRPALPMPSVRLAATEPTPAIAETPSAIQAMKTPKPRRPPRRSRQANRPAKPYPAANGVDKAERELSVTVMTARSPDSRFRRRSRLDVSGAHVQHAIAACRQRRIVRDENQRGAALGLTAEQKLDDLAPGCFVEIAGRFVGDDDGRVGRQGAGERDPLLLAAGKLGGIMPSALRQADGGEFALGDCLCVGHAGELERHC